MVQDERELLEAWKAGDRSAGDALFERYFDLLRRFFRNKVNHGIADLIQQTFLGAVEARDRFRGDTDFRLFLLGIARNIVRRYYRDRQRGREFDPLVVSVHDLNPSPSTIAAKRREHELLLNALRRIPLDLQIALELYYWEDMTVPELAEVLEIPEGTARSRIRRGKEIVERRLGQVLGRDDSTDEDTFLAWARAIRQILDD